MKRINASNSKRRSSPNRKAVRADNQKTPALRAPSISFTLQEMLWDMKPKG